jgi:hypothetical protein
MFWQLDVVIIHLNFPALWLYGLSSNNSLYYGKHADSGLIYLKGFSLGLGALQKETYEIILLFIFFLLLRVR